MDYWEMVDAFEAATRKLQDAQFEFNTARTALYDAHLEEMRRVARGDIEMRDPVTGVPLRPPVKE